MWIQALPRQKNMRFSHGRHYPGMTPRVSSDDLVALYLIGTLPPSIFFKNVFFLKLNLFQACLHSMSMKMLHLAEKN